MKKETVKETVTSVVSVAMLMKARDKLFYEELGAESHRGAAILAAEYFHERLGKAIEQKYSTLDDGLWMRIEENGLKDKFRSRNFSSRIVIAYVLGIYDRETRDRLNDVRHIRNCFAHPHIGAPIDFNTPHVADRCAKFKLTNIPVPDNWRNRYIHFLEEAGDRVWSALDELGKRINSE